MKKTMKRLAAGLLSLVLMIGLLPAVTPEAQAASWMDPYLETMLEWGAIKADSSGKVDGYKQLTRADFVAMVNRAFGYTEVGENPFTDVPDTAWYAEDIRIAYKAGYFQGTSETTASPNALVTREQAAVLLARNLRMKGTSGEVLDFTDSRQMGNWSRGLVQEAARLGIIQGYEDGSFKPKNPITLGQMSAFLVRALGTMIQEPGEYSNMGVYHHLTISSPNVTLKNVTVTGNLYLAGGVGLEDIVLENVTVQGKIVVAGGGEAQAGESSVILRNVTAEELVVDSLTNQFLSLKSEGLTDIGTVDVRTSSYIEDLTKDGLGLQRIELNGGEGVSLQLVGNIKEVINLTSGSALNFAQGVANTVIVDETATGTTVNIDGSAYIKDLKLDAGATVTGAGDVANVSINAAGSTITMLPDTITVRPGLTANIYGEEMDSTAAAESSEDPRILSGYPKTQNVAAKTAEVVFSTNKKGTLYWAVTALSDGSLKEEELVKPTSSKIIKSGTISVTASGTEELAKLSGLTNDGSYYISAVLEDNRGMRSPVKVCAFTTPDDTTPAFASGYPVAIMAEDKTTGNIVVQTQVMANKDCRLYYALMPTGSTAPTAADFKAGALSGNLGHGVVDLTKNVPFLVSPVNTSVLKEQTKYDLYLWLTDVDGAKSSAVKKLTIETPDRTAPVIQGLDVSGIEAKSVTLTFSLDEPGTLYWAVVKQGTTFYSDGVDATSLESINSDSAKMQVETALGALKKGSSNAAKGSTDYTFTISGLEAQTIYDLYFVAKDKAGNYNVYTTEVRPPKQINTKDDVPPTVTQEFTRNDGTDEKPVPYPDTNINLIFSENVQGVTYDGANRNLSNFLELYQTACSTGDYTDLANALERHIELYYYPETGGTAKKVTARTSDSDTDWTIDYRKAVVRLDPGGSGELTISFPYDEDPAESAIKLSGGTTYYFLLKDIADTSDNVNLMKDYAKGYKLPEFTVVSAQVYLAEGTKSSGTLEDGTPVSFHMNFDATPLSNDNMASDIYTDLIFWCDDAVDFELYYKKKTEDSWTKVGNGSIGSKNDGRRLGVSMSYIAIGNDTTEKLLGGLIPLKDLTAREYGIQITSINGETNSNNWNQPIEIYITAVSGVASKLAESTRVLKNSGVYGTVISDSVRDITSPAGEMSFSVKYTFMDNTPPEFTNLTISAGDTGATIKFALDRPNSRYYYVVAKAGDVNTTVKNKDGTDSWSVDETTGWDRLPEKLTDNNYPVYATIPNNQQIKKGYSDPTILSGNGKYVGISVELDLKDLEPEKEYVLYMVLEGESVDSASEVYCFGFKTDKTDRPIIRSNPSSSSSVTVTVDKTSYLSYILIVNGQEGEPFNKSFSSSQGVGTATAEFPENVYPNVKTVLQAMATYVYDGNVVKGTVFDLYGTEATKQAVEERITSQKDTNSVVIKVGQNVSFDQNVSQEITSDDIAEGQRYTLLIVGSARNGSESAFRASYPVYKAEEKKLMVTNCVLSYDPRYNEKNVLTTGTLMVTFDDTLYVKSIVNGVQQIVPLDTCLSDISPNTHDGTTIDRLSNYTSYTDSQKVALVEKGHEKTMQSVNFQITNATPNTSISFDKELCGSSGVLHGQGLTLTLVKVSDGNGGFTWDVTVTPDWDATTN